MCVAGRSQISEITLYRKLINPSQAHNVRHHVILHLWHHIMCEASRHVKIRSYCSQVNNPRLRWAYLPYSMHMAGPREAIQHMIIRKNYGESCVGECGVCHQ